MGIGHVDHIRTRRVVLRALRECRKDLNGCALYVYEEIPYRDEFPADVKRLENAFMEWGRPAAIISEDVQDVYEQKLGLLGVYASQWKLARIAAKVPSIEHIVQLSWPFADAS
jgi:LmbE family N-acetylglucosaminyl deacetylase